jgi:hypothetical protein
MGSGLGRKAHARPMPTETGSRPIHQGNGGPVFGMELGPAACGGAPPAGAVALADGDSAPAEGVATPGATAPALGVGAGVAEGLGEPVPLGAPVPPGDKEVAGERELPGPDGLRPERTISMTTPRNSNTAMTAATGRKVWAPAPPRRAMAASYLSDASPECGKAKLYP